MNRVYIKGDHVDYINERFSFSIENVFVIVKYKKNNKNAYYIFLLSFRLLLKSYAIPDIFISTDKSK